MSVRGVMTKDPLSVEPDAPIATARAVMIEREIRHLPVVDAGGRVIGMVSVRDLREAAIAPVIEEYHSPAARRRLRGLGEALDRLRVRDVMRWGAVTIPPDAPVAQAAAMMFEARVSSLPVIETGRLVGIVTERDLLRALAATLPPIKGIDPDTYLW
jgi:acetoin utilization protein AcuB